MKIVRLALCFFVALPLAGAFAQDLFKSAPKPKRKGPLPTVKEVDNAFSGKTDQPRANLYLKLKRAEDGADRPEIVAAIVKGLDKRLEKQAIVGPDLQLISLLANLESEPAEEALVRYMKGTDARITIVALRALTESNRLPQWSDVLAITERTDYDDVFALRRGVVAAAEQDASKESVDFLIDTVSTMEGQLKYEAARSLTTLTGQPFGGFGDKWAAWWKTARDKFEPVAGKDRMAGSLRANMPWDEPVPRFYQLPIYARKVLFMVDRSGSMMFVDDNGESRIDRARRELELAIAKLSPKAAFDIVAFHDSVQAFSPRLMPADDETKLKAVMFGRNLIATKDTNVYDALSMALDADPNLEAIYLLSDGEPTTGAIVEPPKIVDAVSLQNQLRVTAIYTLGIDARGDFEKFLRQLAEKNYGEFFSIR